MSKLEAIQQVKLQMPLFVPCELHAGVAQAKTHSSHGSADRDPCEMSWCSNPYQRY